MRAVLAAEVEKVLAPVAQPLLIDPAHRPFVILMIGVNGSGKTTTIGKLAAKFRAEGKSVMLAAGDTFRAAAIEQLQIWGQPHRRRVVIANPAGSDASGLAFDAVTRARAEAADVLIIDTAGRLQNRDELMSELEKIIRVIKKVDPSAPHATLLTLDATTGQNALNQVEIFGKRAGVTGLVMTKLDGTARGGILVAIARKFGLARAFHRRRRKRRRSRAFRGSGFCGGDRRQGAGMTDEPQQEGRCELGADAAAGHQAGARTRAAGGVLRRQRPRRHLYAATAWFMGAMVRRCC